MHLVMKRDLFVLRPFVWVMMELQKIERKKEMKFNGNNNEKAQNETRKQIYKYINFKIPFTRTINS